MKQVPQPSHPVRLVAAAMLVLVSTVAAYASPVNSAFAGAPPATTSAFRALPRADTPTPTTTASTAPDPVSANIESLTPLVPTPDATLAISGRVTNRSDRTATDVSVRLRISPTPLEGRFEIDQVLSGNTSREGASLDRTRVDVAASLTPAQQQPYALAVPFKDTNLGTSASANGVYVVAVETLGRTSPDRPIERLGLTRSFLPWYPQPAQLKPSKIVWLWPVTTAPGRDANGVLSSEATPDEMVPGGRLSRLLDAAPTDPGALSWLVDPQLLDEASAIGNGYRVVTATGITEGTSPAAAKAWLNRAAALLKSADVRALPYAVPDVVALHRANLDSDVVLSTTSAAPLTSRLLGRPVPGQLAWPTDGVLDAGTLELLRSAAVTTIILRDTAAPPNPSVSYTPSGSVALASLSGPARAVLADTGLSNALAMPQRTTAQILLARQRFLAETGLITSELPTVSRTVVALATPTWDPSTSFLRDSLTALSTAPWTATATLSDLLTAEPSTVPRERARYTREDAALELPPSLLARVAAQQRSLRTYREVVSDPSTDSDRFTAALLRVESGIWRGAPDAASALLVRISAQLDDLKSGVRVLSRSKVNFPGETGVIPVTIANDLPHRVTVGVRLTGNPTVRLQVTQPDLVELAPGQRVTIQVQAQVLGSGAVPVDVALTTPAGEIYSAPVTITVATSAYSRAAAWIVGGAFLLLLALIAVNLVRRIRVRRSGSSADTS